MMATASALMLCLCVIYLLIPAAVSFHSLLCPDPLAPLMNKTVATRRSGSPPFMLHVTKDNSNVTQAGSEQYRVEVSSHNSLLKFATAQIAVVKTETCGYGELTFHRTDFYKEPPANRICPLMLVTTNPEKEHKSPSLLWKPPSCGCVQFRVLVFEDETGYYRDDENDDNGHLTATVCVKKREDRQQYINALCRIRNRYSAAEIVNRDTFKVRHGLRDAARDKRLLVAIYEARLEKINECCGKETEDSRDNCLLRTRFRRVDHLCEGGIPDLSFTALRRAYTRGQERKCCFIMGTNRYTCFNHKSEFPASSREPGILDYSLDETDPLNDLADIATHLDGDILSMLSRLELGVKFESDEDGSVKMRDVGSKQVSSEEPSSSVERLDRRRPMQGGVKPKTIEVPNVQVKDIATPPVRPERPTPKESKTNRSSRRKSGGRSRRKGRRRGGKSGRRRNNGAGRRSGRNSRGSRRRMRSRGRSGSKGRRRRKGQSRAGDQLSRRYSFQNSKGELSSAEAIQDRLDRKEKRIQIRKQCCNLGTAIAHDYAGPLADGITHCGAEADVVGDTITQGYNDGVNTACWRMLVSCCTTTFLSFSNRRKVPRIGAREKSDEEGDDLPFGQDYTQADRDSERTYQGMRGPTRPTQTEDEGEDGPASFDRADNDMAAKKNVDGGDMARNGKMSYYTPDPKVASTERSRTASEQVEDFDDRKLIKSGEKDDEDSEEDDDEDEEEEDDDEEDRQDEFARRRHGSKATSSQRRLPYRRRNSQGQRSGGTSRTSRNRERWNTSRGRPRSGPRAGRTNSRGRNSRENNPWFRQNSRGRGRYRSMSRDTGRRSGRERGSRRNSGGRSRGYNGGRSRRDMVPVGRAYESDDGYVDYPRDQYRRTPLDSKEMAEANKRQVDGSQFLRMYYRDN